MTTVQPSQPLVDKAPPPQGHHTAAASHLGADGIPGPALGQQQNHPGSPGILGRPVRLLARFINAVRSDVVNVMVFVMTTIIVYS
ncbi:MAG: hypothetical protein ACXWWG_06415 [Nitrospira sp.]